MNTTENKTISEVRIIYNKRYKKYIKRLQDRFKGYLNSFYTHDLFIEQDVMRNYILEHKQDIDFTKEEDDKPFKITPINKQEIFIIMVSIMSDVDICDSLTEILEQRKHIKNPDEEVEELTAGVDVSTITKCACGHGVHVYNSPVIFNPYTGKFLLIGCDCALKNEILTKDEVKQFKKQIKTNIKKRKEKLLEEKIRAFQEKQKQKLKQQTFNILKQNLINRKSERARLNTLVYLTIPAWFKHIAMDSGCKWIQDIKKWCTTTEIYEANEDLQQFNLYTHNI